MIEPGWISFHQATHEVSKRVGCGWAEAKRTLRSACAEAKIGSMKAPCDPDTLPREFWTAVAHREWREREVDQDGPNDGCEIEIILNEDDYRRWLNGIPLSKPGTLTFRRRKRDTAKEAIAELWPNGIPAVLGNKDIIQRAGQRLKPNGASEVSDDTILRAAGRKT
ncbi:MAG: hypothetical protein WBE90_14895 [Xanthobacteraceae bacterium]|jgi:hypothetical protein